MHLAHDADGGRVVLRPVAPPRALHAPLTDEPRAVQRPQGAVCERGRTRRGEAEERHPGEDERAHRVRAGRGEVDGDAATEGVGEDDGRACQLLQHGGDAPGVVRRAPRLGGGRGGAEAGEVDGDRGELRGVHGAQHRVEVPVGAGPAVQRQDPRLGFSRPGAEEPAAGEGAQHRQHPSPAPWHRRPSVPICWCILPSARPPGTRSTRPRRRSAQAAGAVLPPGGRSRARPRGRSRARASPPLGRDTLPTRAPGSCDRAHHLGSVGGECLPRPAPHHAPASTASWPGSNVPSARP